MKKNYLEQTFSSLSFDISDLTCPSISPSCGNIISHCKKKSKTNRRKIYSLKASQIHSPNQEVEKPFSLIRILSVMNNE